MLWPSVEGDPSVFIYCRILVFKLCNEVPDCFSDSST
jgi:hypothetical protein